MTRANDCLNVISLTPLNKSGIKLFQSHITGIDRRTKISDANIANTMTFITHSAADQNKTFLYIAKVFYNFNKLTLLYTDKANIVNHLLHIVLGVLRSVLDRVRVNGDNNI